jgi:hypothetical protein
MTTVLELPPFSIFCRDVLGLDPSTRQGVLAFMAALDGEPLTLGQIALLEKYTGRPYVHRPAGNRQGVLAGGAAKRQERRRGGAAQCLCAFTGQRTATYIPYNSHVVPKALLVLD